MSLLTAIFKTLVPLVPASLVHRGAREFFNHRFPSLGTMTTLQIDSARQRVTLDLELKGETQPLHIVIDRYELTTVDEKTFIELKEVTTSREWMNVLAKEFLKGKKFEVPEAVRSVL